jgi:hypothetical protein
LARAQLPLVEAAAQEATAYLDWADSIVERLAGAPLPAHPKALLVVVLGPERPYCGALPRQIADAIPDSGELGLVGQRLCEAALADPLIARRVRFQLPGATTHDEHEEVGRQVALAVLEHHADRQVELVYPRRDARSLERRVLLAGTRAAALAPPDTYAPLVEVLDRAVTEALSGRLAVGVVEALHAEVLARIAAADRARGACDRKLEELGLAWRVARQERITNELLEAVAGAQAAAETGGGAPIRGSSRSVHRD